MVHLEDSYPVTQRLKSPASKPRLPNLSFQTQDPKLKRPNTHKEKHAYLFALFCCLSLLGHGRVGDSLRLLGCLEFFYCASASLFW